MGRDTSAIFIGIGINIIAAIFNLVVEIMPTWLTIILVVIGLALIIFGTISFIKGRHKGSVGISAKGHSKVVMRDSIVRGFDKAADADKKSKIEIDRSKLEK